MQAILSTIYFNHFETKRMIFSRIILHIAILFNRPRARDGNGNGVGVGGIWASFSLIFFVVLLLYFLCFYNKINGDDIKITVVDLSSFIFVYNKWNSVHDFYCCFICTVFLPNIISLVISYMFRIKYETTSTPTTALNRSSIQRA